MEALNQGPASARQDLHTHHILYLLISCKACNRMRELGNGQSLAFFIPPVWAKAWYRSISLDVCASEAILCAFYIYLRSSKRRSTEDSRVGSHSYPLFDDRRARAEPGDGLEAATDKKSIREGILSHSIYTCALLLVWVVWNCKRSCEQRGGGE